MCFSWLSGLPSETYTFSDVPLHRSVAANLRNQFDTAFYSDVTIKCGDKEIKCHKLLLVQYSTVFNRMFQGSFDEAQNNEVNVKDIAPELLTKALAYLYGNDIHLTAADVMPLLQFGDMYDITPLREVSGKMLLKHINPSVAMTVWMYAKRYHAPEFYSNCQKYCAKNFSSSNNYTPQIVTSAGYYHADKDVIIDLLADHALNVPCEESVFDAIIDWVMFDQQQRATHLHELLSKVLRTERLSSHAVHSKLEQVGCSALGDRMKVSLFELWHDVAGVCLTHPLLRPRSLTAEVDALGCYIYIRTEANYSRLTNHHIAKLNLLLVKNQGPYE